MRILMLGWEFPPYITGGLGVACHGLTRALDRLGHEVVFLIPRLADDAEPGLVTVLASGARRARSASACSSPLTSS